MIFYVLLDYLACTIMVGLMKPGNVVSGRILVVKIFTLVVAFAVSPAVYAYVLGSLDVAISYWLALSVILATRLSVGTGVSKLASVTLKNAETDASRVRLARSALTIVSFIGSSLVATIMLGFLGIEATFLSALAAQAAVVLLSLLAEAVSSALVAFNSERK